MNKIVLTETQLESLKTFIRKRGFKDEVVVAEILDHFACKVEEIVSSHPRMSFQEATEKAHHSFGPAGFYPVASAFEKQLSAKYSRMFWSQLRHVLLSPRYLLALIPACYLAFRGMIWAETNGYRHLLDMNDAALTMWILLLCYELKLQVQTQRLKFPCYIKAVNPGDFIIGTILMYTIIDSFTGIHTPPSARPASAIWLYAAYNTVLAFIVVVRQIAFAHILKQAKAELVPS